MFAPLKNTPLRYAWGARGAISAVLGDGGAVDDCECRAADAEAAPVQAELWLGAHHGSPARLVDAESIGHEDLRSWIHADPDATLGPFASGLRRGEPVRLPFLLKVLAAGQPLSLQVHPDLPRARAGFAAENARDIPIDAPHRNYRDPFHKPELLVALSDTMTALAGFRAFDEVRQLTDDVDTVATERGMGDAFAPFRDRIARLDGPAPLRELMEFNLSGAPEAAAIMPILDEWVRRGGGWQREKANVAAVRAAHPADASVLTVLLMNHLTLHRGESVYVRAGVLHAYVQGVGIEVMAASDNVLRGGLTPKHIDVPELLSVIEFTPTPPPFLGAEALDAYTTTFEPDEPDFRLQRVRGDEVDTRVAVVGPSVLLNLGGDVEIEDTLGTAIHLAHGEAVFTTPDAPPIRVRGERVDVIVASAGVDAGEALPLD